MVYFVNKSFEPKTKVKTFGKTPLLTTTRKSRRKSNEDPAQPKKEEYFSKKDLLRESFACFVSQRLYSYWFNKTYKYVELQTDVKTSVHQG